MISNLEVRITAAADGKDPRTGAPAPNTEIFYTYKQGGVDRRALTRLPWALANTPHQVACEREAFLKRQGA